MLLVTKFQTVPCATIERGLVEDAVSWFGSDQYDHYHISYCILRSLDLCIMRYALWTSCPCVPWWFQPKSYALRELCIITLCIMKKSTVVTEADDLQKPAIATVFQKLLTHGSIIASGNRDEDYCHRHGWMHSEQPSGNTCYTFPTPLHAMYVSWRLVPITKQCQFETIRDIARFMMLHGSEAVCEEWLMNMSDT
jgi:hypothetical protein